MSRPWTVGLQRVTMAAAIFAACLGWTLVRTGGFTGAFDNDLAWRWTATAEDRILAMADDTPSPTLAAVATPERPAVSVPSAPSVALVVGPSFRGRDRDGIVRDVRIAADWSASPPKELWRRPIGPGWSSFSVHGDVFYTQEQRGEEEIVAAYRVSTEAPVWKHRDQARFWESNGGPGPRGTPTIADSRIYSLGATGILNVLDQATGRVIWTRNAGADTNTNIPDWGFRLRHC